MRRSERATTIRRTVVLRCAFCVSYRTPTGERLFVRGDRLLLIYVGSDALPDGLTSDSLGETLGSSGELLRSRQGKLADLHVVADRGVAWSEVDGEIGFVELFPPTTLPAYRRNIYQRPPTFAQ